MDLVEILLKGENQKNETFYPSFQWRLDVGLRARRRWCAVPTVWHEHMAVEDAMTALNEYVALVERLDLD